MPRLALLLALLPATAAADAPVIEAARVAGAVIQVTLSHPDTGWDHYADGWEVLAADGTRLGLRTLLHPHVTEQPFTRSLTLDGPLPPGPLAIRARCSVDGWSTATTALSRD